MNLVHAYVDVTDPDEPIVVLSDKALSAEAIPFLPAKLVKERKVHAIAFSVSRKDKKLTNTYDKASFTVKGSGTTGEKAAGSIKMILENKKWKVSEDKWEIKN